MQTTAPRCAAFIRGAAARTTRTIPVRSTSIVLCHSASVIVASGIVCAIPAFATITSNAPRRRSTSATTASVAAVSRTSRRWNSAEPPAERIAATVDSPASTSTSVTTTWSPSAANVRAQACPMPMPAPVISTFRIATLTSSDDVGGRRRHPFRRRD
jgi:hypothetical protein